MHKSTPSSNEYYSDTLGTLLTISQRFNFSEFPFTDLIFYGIDPEHLAKRVKSTHKEVHQHLEKSYAVTMK
jgi:hypothetical protein